MISHMSAEARIPRLSLEEVKLAAAKIGLPAQLAELSVFRVLLRHPELEDGGVAWPPDGRGP
jgi:hypothetical protein